MPRVPSCILNLLRRLRRYVSPEETAEPPQGNMSTIPNAADLVIRKQIQSANSLSTEITIDEAIAQMERILASPTLIHCNRLKLLLAYIVDNTLHKKSGELKETVIAVELFGMASNFNRKIDGVVRQNAGRLRIKLLQYYVEYGRDDPIVITIPLGHYIAVFERRKGGNPGNGGSFGGPPEPNKPPSPATVLPLSRFGVG